MVRYVVGLMECLNFGFKRNCLNCIGILFYVHWYMPNVLAIEVANARMDLHLCIVTRHIKSNRSIFILLYEIVKSDRNLKLPGKIVDTKL